MTFYSVKILKCEIFELLYEEILKRRPVLRQIFKGKPFLIV